MKLLVPTGNLQNAQGVYARNRSAAWVLIAFIVGRTLVGVWLGFRPFDDSFITFRYALNLATANGFTYNAPERVLGTTTPLWTLLLAATRWIGLSIPTVSITSALLLDALSACFIVRTLCNLGSSAVSAVVAGVVFLSVSDYLTIARSGMETSLFVCLVLGTLCALSACRALPAGLACGLAILTRPEGIILVPIVFLAILTSIEKRGRLRGLVGAAIALGAITGPWIIFAWLYFGSVVSQSVIAKAHHSAIPGLSNINLLLFFVKGQFGGSMLERTYLQGNFVLTALALVGCAALVARAWLARTAQDRLPALLLLSFPVCFVGGLGITHAFTWFPWYYGPIYPFLIMLATVGASRILSFRSVLRPKTREIILMCLAALFLCVQILAVVRVKWPREKTDFWVEGLAASVKEVPRDGRTRVCAAEIGVVGWVVWPAKVDDMAGLVTPEALGQSRLHYIQTSRPQFISVRSDEAAESLKLWGESNWFRKNYVAVREIRDPYFPRSFILFQRMLKAGEDGDDLVGVRE